LVNWLALIGMLGQLLVPVYGMAAAPQGDGAIPICTANGVIWVSLGDEDAPISPNLPVEKPCHFCISQATPYSASGAIGWPIRAAHQGAQAFRPAEHQFRSTHAYTPQHTRAPPAPS
jgi:hypothetical protein